MQKDTTPDAQRFYYQRLAQMTPEERVHLAVELCEAADQMLRARIRRQFPDAQGADFEYQLLRARYGQELADRVYGR